MKTSQVPRLLPRRPMIRITAKLSELRTLIVLIERNAAQAERELRCSAADYSTQSALRTTCSGTLKADWLFYYHAAVVEQLLMLEMPALLRLGCDLG